MLPEGPLRPPDLGSGDLGSVEIQLFPQPQLLTQIPYPKVGCGIISDATNGIFVLELSTTGVVLQIFFDDF